MSWDIAKPTTWVAIAMSLALAGWAPTPAFADGLSFGFSTGHGHGRHHHRHHPGFYSYGYFGPRVVYAPPVVVAPYPPVYPAPIYQPPLSAAPASPVYQTHDGRVCREYQAMINIGGTMQPSYGTACQQPDGSWRIAN